MIIDDDHDDDDDIFYFIHWNIIQLSCTRMLVHFYIYYLI